MLACVTLQDIAGFAGYRRTLPKLILFCTVGIATGGLLFLLAHWFLDIKLRFSLQACHLHQAHFVVVTVRNEMCDDVCTLLMMKLVIRSWLPAKASLTTDTPARTTVWVVLICSWLTNDESL